MSAREGNVFARLKDRVTRPEDRFERVENGMLTGMPDVNYCMAGIEGWIELKAPIEPARPTTALFGSGNHPVEVEQANWLLKQSRAGGRGWLFIATEHRLLLLRGHDVGKFGARGINTLTAHALERISVWRVQQPVLDPLRWADLREVLTK